MRVDEFDEQMDRLRSAYGEKNYPKDGERDQAIYARVKTLPVEQFRDTLTHLIGENFSPPSVKVISETLPTYRRSSVGMAPIPPDDCQLCNDRGVYFDGDVLKACRCARGRHMNPAELARMQAKYDQAAGLEGRPRLRDLPYDAKEREGA